MTHLMKASPIVACIVVLLGSVGQGQALAAEAACQSSVSQVKALSSDPSTPKSTSTPM